MSADIPIARLFDLTGTVLGDRYEVLGKLGEGGMASVYEGRRIGLRNRVAIKVLKPELCEDPSNVKRFLREAKAASVIEHENIVDIVDFGEVDSLPVYYVMEFLEGQDFKEELKKQPMPWLNFGPLLIQICTALAAAHDAGIVHRDVKPANIFLVSRYGSQPLVKVLDFGIAKVVDNGRGLTQGMTMTNGILGTVAYMAPEQARGEQLDARTDIYQLGVVMYQALTGTVPFKGRNPFVVLGQHVNDTPRPPRELRSEIPEAVESVVLTCLAKDPAQRFQSMRALRNAVRGLLPAEPEYTDPLPPPSSSGSSVSFDPGSMGWAPPVNAEVGVPNLITTTEKLGSGSHRTIGGSIADSRPPAGRGRATEPLPAESVIETAVGGLTGAVAKASNRAYDPSSTARGNTAPVTGFSARPLVTTTTIPERTDTTFPGRAGRAAKPSARPNTLAVGFGLGMLVAVVAGAAYLVTSTLREPASDPETPELTPTRVIEAVQPAPNPTIPERQAVRAEPEPPETVEPEPEPEPEPVTRPRGPRRPRPRQPTSDATKPTAATSAGTQPTTDPKEPERDIPADLKRPSFLQD